MKTVSLEYCHVTPGAKVEETIKESNYWTPKALELMGGVKIQKCIMVDDLHAKEKISKAFIKHILTKSKIEPDCIYLESELINHAEELINKIDPSLREFVYSKDKLWLKEEADNYIKFNSEFLISWQDKKGNRKYSCSLMTAASYMARLGAIRDYENIKTIYGDRLQKMDYCLNVLSSEYLLTEDKTQSIIEAVDKKLLRKIGWFLY